MVTTVAIIPSRFASSRFPGKPLVSIAGKSMIQRVYEKASQAESLTEVVVATDDQRIFDHVREFGGNVMMTSASHISGTERCAEAIGSFSDAELVMNIQGDEPFIDPRQIDLLAGILKDSDTMIATLIKHIDNTEDLLSDTVVKVVKDLENNALYFSRSPIPYIKGSERPQWTEQHVFFKHIGIYAYRTSVLKELAALPPSILEMKEGLEQLRWMENGYRIRLAETEHESNSVDTPSDLDRLLREMKL